MVRCTLREIKTMNETERELRDARNVPPTKRNTKYFHFPFPAFWWLRSRFSYFSILIRLRLVFMMVHLCVQWLVVEFLSIVRLQQSVRLLLLASEMQTFEILIVNQVEWWIVIRWWRRRRRRCRRDSRFHTIWMQFELNSRHVFIQFTIRQNANDRWNECEWDERWKRQRKKNDSMEIEQIQLFK